MDKTTKKKTAGALVKVPAAKVLVIQNVFPFALQMNWFLFSSS